MILRVRKTCSKMLSNDDAGYRNAAKSFEFLSPPDIPGTVLGYPTAFDSCPYGLNVQREATFPCSIQLRASHRIPADGASAAVACLRSSDCRGCGFRARSTNPQAVRQGRHGRAVIRWSAEAPG